MSPKSLIPNSLSIVIALCLIFSAQARTLPRDSDFALYIFPRCESAKFSADVSILCPGCSSVKDLSMKIFVCKNSDLCSEILVPRNLLSSTTGDYNLGTLEKLLQMGNTDLSIRPGNEISFYATYDGEDSDTIESSKGRFEITCGLSEYLNENPDAYSAEDYSSSQSDEMELEDDEIIILKNHSFENASGKENSDSSGKLWITIVASVVSIMALVGTVGLVIALKKRQQQKKPTAETEDKPSLLRMSRLSYQKLSA